LEGVLQQTLGQLEDVGLRRAVDRLASLGEGESEGQLDDLLAPFARDQLEALGDARRLHVLDAGVQILDVLADDDDVQLAAGERGLNAGQLAHGTDVAVRLEQCAQSDVGAPISVADRRLEGAFEDDAIPFDGLNRVFGNTRYYSLLECAGAGFALFEFDGGAGRLYDRDCCINNLWPDPIAREYGYLSFRSCHQRKLIPLGSRFLARVAQLDRASASG